MSDKQIKSTADMKTDVDNRQVFVYKGHNIKFTVTEDDNGNVTKLSEYSKLDMLKLYSKRSLLTYYFIEKFSSFELHEKLPLSFVLDCFAQMERIDQRNKYDTQYCQQMTEYIEETKKNHINSALNPLHELPKQLLFPPLQRWYFLCMSFLWPNLPYYIFTVFRKKVLILEVHTYLNYCTYEDVRYSFKFVKQ